MLDWVFGLQSVLDEVVDRVSSAPTQLPQHRMFFYRLARTDLAETQPTHVARLLRHLLSCLTGLADGCNYIEQLVRALLPTGARREDLNDICESMARLGCQSAATLRAMIAERS